MTLQAMTADVELGQIPHTYADLPSLSWVQGITVHRCTGTLLY